MKLPQTFLDRLTTEIGEDGRQAYLAAMEEPYVQALRANPLKIAPHDLAQKLSLTDPVPWCENGFYVASDHTYSHSPFYYAGLYYLQEPSAMAPASMLPAAPGDRVLDLCAAPGGKSTALGAKLRGEGVLVANDISPSRAQALLKNLELFGITNAVVTCESPHKLAQRFTHYFDRILIDAPCSGEGMFRKDPSITKNWEQYGTAYYVKLQKEILRYVPELLAPGGSVMYATCTYAREEDEDQVAYLQTILPSLQVIQTQHFYPHTVRGEGQFAALLQDTREKGLVSEETLPEESVPTFEAWAASNLKNFSVSHLQLSGENVYAMSLPKARLEQLRVLRPGFWLGTVHSQRFEPSQALAMALKKEQAQATVTLSDPTRYLKGETMETPDAKDGYNLICVEDYPLGWGKVSDGICKNKYLKGWRMMR